MKAYNYITQIGHLTMVKPDNDDNYHIFIDNDYQGKVVKLKGQWIGHLVYDSDLTIDEVQLLGKIIEEKLGKAV